MPLRFNLDLRSLNPFFRRLVACHRTVVELRPACSKVLRAHSRFCLRALDLICLYSTSAAGSQCFVSVVFSLIPLRFAVSSTEIWGGTRSLLKVAFSAADNAFVNLSACSASVPSSTLGGVLSDGNVASV